MFKSARQSEMNLSKRLHKDKILLMVSFSYIELEVHDNTLHVFSRRLGFFVTKWQLQLSDFVLYELWIYEKIHHKTYFLLKCFLNNPLFHSVCYDFPVSCFTSGKMTTLSISLTGLPRNCCDKIPWLFHHRITKFHDLLINIHVVGFWKAAT